MLMNKISAMQTIVKNMFRIILIHIIVLLTFVVNAQTWDVPADKKNKTSSFTFTNETQKKGEEIFLKTCVACHGNPGQGNFNKTLNPVPPDIVTDRVQKQTDGELFYKITTGRGLMPSFKNIISDNDRWNIVSYFRSFNKTYKQPPLSVAVDSVKMLAVHIFPEFDPKTNKVSITLKAFEKNDTLVLKNTEVILFAQRYFGILQIDSTRRSGTDGSVIFNFPADLPGDKEGMINCLVKINDEIYGEVEREFSMKSGIPTDKPSLTEKRAMWNVLSKAPVWLLITYTLVVVGIWSFLILIILRIFKINKIGKQKK